MKIWVDADACPKAIKDILVRAAGRVGVRTIFIANQPMRLPESEFVRKIQVPGGSDVADDKIVELLHSGDLVITADIPLAARVVDKDVVALDPRGDFYSKENIRERLSIRDFMDGLRSTGVETGGPASFKQKDSQAFANQLDRFLTKHARKKNE